MNNLIVLVICSCCIEIATGHPTTLLPRTTPEQDISLEDAEKWLKKYDYMQDTDEEGPAATKDLSGALKLMQQEAGIKETGKLDEETKKLMKSRHCGNKNIRIKVSKRFDTNNRWTSNRLTYAILRYPTNTYNLVYNTWVDYYIGRAFKYWSDAADITFTQVRNSNADITIGFYSYSHGDGYPFDGKGGNWAHAFYPSDGRVHFDDAEAWSYNNLGDVNLEQLATHMIGHAIGLKHSNIYEAVMYAYYRYRSSFQLHQDDKNGVIYLYGSKGNPNTPRRPVPTSPPTTVTTTNNRVSVDRTVWQKIKSQMYQMYLLYMIYF